MNALEHTVDHLGSIATRRQLVARGFSSDDLTRAVSAGFIARVRRGWYASRSASMDQIIAVRVGGRLTGSSAARTFGLWAGTDTSVHVALQRGASRLRPPVDESDVVDGAPIPEVVLHWTEQGGARRASGDTWRVSLASCLRSVVRNNDRETAVACMDTAIQKYSLTGARVSAVFAGEPLRSRLIALQAHGGCDSGIESIFCQRFRRHRFPMRHQVRFPSIRRVDLLIGRRVIVELDGREFHDTSAAFTRDRRGDAELAALGYVVLRFSYAQVMFEWDFVERTVLAALVAHP